jgi:hypothetical protein
MGISRGMNKESQWMSMGVYKAWESRHGKFIDPPSLRVPVERWGFAGWVTPIHERRSMPDEAVCEPVRSTLLVGYEWDRWERWERARITGECLYCGTKRKV